jgi:hypothetical protein
MVKVDVPLLQILFCDIVPQDFLRFYSDGDFQKENQLMSICREEWKQLIILRITLTNY